MDWKFMEIVHSIHFFRSVGNAPHISAEWPNGPELQAIGIEI